MKLVRAIALVAGVVLLAGVTQSTQAQTLGEHGSWGFGHPGFFGHLSSPYATGRIPTPPYFAIHPPVYYSAPVPRSYGYSPYAYPGTVRTPEIMVAPEMIENPHAKPAIHQVDQKIKMAVIKPLLVINPYASQDTTQLAAIRSN